MSFKYISLFSGIEAASVAWEPLGWEPMAFSEIDPFCSAVLAARYPDVPNLGDITKVDWKEFVREHGRPDVLVGGSPCFPAGTLVDCADAFKPIEDVAVGDMVLTHRHRYRRVLRTGNHKASVVRLTSRKGRTLTCTPNHPILADGWEWVPASEMAGRLWLLPDRGEWQLVTSVEQVDDGPITVYNLEVEGDNSYTADGIAVHNCQSFSVAAAAKRTSLGGESRLMFEYIRACGEVHSPWIVWENVPGVFSVKDRAFEQLITSLQDIGYVSLAWRVLDAQFVRVADRDGDGRIAGWHGPVAQRRRRVFLVGHLGDGGVPQRYSLSPKACEGILRRAARRGRSLPKLLEDSLVAQMKAV